MSWIKEAVGFATFSFILMVIFIVLSDPYVMLLDTVENESRELVNGTQVNNSIVPFLNTLRTVFGLLFVLSMFSLVVGIFLKSHEEEYEEYPNNYNRRL